MKVKLNWCVMPSDGAAPEHWLEASRDFDLPFLPFLGLRIYFLVRPAHEKDPVSGPEHGGKRELGYTVSHVEYWPHDGALLLSDDSYDGSANEPSAYSREVWLRWFEDAGFSVEATPPTAPKAPRHLRPVH